MFNARIHYEDSDRAAKVVNLPKVSFSSDDSKSTILINAQYANSTLNLTGKTSSLRKKAYFAWDQAPVAMNLDLTLTLNGKSLLIKGEIDKKPQNLPAFNVNLYSQSFDLLPLAGAAMVTGSTSKSSPKTASAPIHQSDGKYFFSDEPISFDLLPIANGSIDIHISELGISGQAPLINFKSNL
ncbi:MAG TPA: hypothetical protein DCW35_09475 [Polynucleobacter sp.]|nr:hypothetical protein [Polynucleobacter sp.]